MSPTVLMMAGKEVRAAVNTARAYFACFVAWRGVQALVYTLFSSPLGHCIERVGDSQNPVL